VCGCVEFEYSIVDLEGEDPLWLCEPSFSGILVNHFCSCCRVDERMDEG